MTEEGGMNQHDVLASARLAAEWFFDRRERLELHENEPIALLWLAVREIEAILDGFHALETLGLLTVENRVLRDDLSEVIDRAA
ncbi:MAG: hypothetical protein ACRDNE_12015 [Gaiellaceae bacterium]